MLGFRDSLVSPTLANAKDAVVGWKSRTTNLASRPPTPFTNDWFLLLAPMVRTAPQEPGCWLGLEIDMFRSHQEPRLFCSASSSGILQRRHHVGSHFRNVCIQHSGSELWYHHFMAPTDHSLAVIGRVRILILSSSRPTISLWMGSRAWLFLWANPAVSSPSSYSMA